MRTLTLLLLLLISLPVSAQNSTLVGSYTVAGTEKEQPYTGRADITEENGVLNIEWFNDAGESSGIGVGLREGNVVSVIFRNVGGFGLVSYKIDGTKWIGTFTYPGVEGVFPEVLTKHDPRLHGADKGPKRQM